MAQNTMLCSVAIACTFPASTSSRLPSSPCPYSEIRAGVGMPADDGTMHSNCAVATLPGICVGRASGLRDE